MWLILKTKCSSVNAKGNELLINILGLTCGNLNSILFYFTLSYSGRVNLQYSYVLHLFYISVYWVAVRRTYVFTLQEVEKICRTLQSHVIPSMGRKQRHYGIVVVVFVYIY